ncbi:MAG: phosphodiester glycosidase family protein [Leptolyngbya sp. SIO3F4]|nr:phosphodiester glycosidase family protein [Leptolyngbya sp. SIO3F4]
MQCAVQPEPDQISVVETQIPQPTLSIQNWPNDGGASVARIHMVVIPPNYPVEVVVDDGLKTVEEFAADTNALAVMNGGFFDPNNAQTTSFITIDRFLVADPRNNRRLVDNPALTIYMDQILNRSEFRRYDCGEDIRYDITFHNEAIPSGCMLHSALGAGPQLLPDDTSQIEGFTDYANDVLIRDAIGSKQRNARSAIGIKQDGGLVWLMVAQVDSSGGMTLPELSAFMANLGIQKALNLDGGSSSSLYTAFSDAVHSTQSKVYYGKLNQSAQVLQRPIKSVLLLSK